jgi:hypothetical protein
MRRSAKYLTLALTTFVIAGCGYQFKPAPENKPKESVFGPGGLVFGPGAPKDTPDGPRSGIAVNAELWRATLEIFAPYHLLQADPYGGTILYDWTAAPDAPTERFRFNVVIRGEALKAENISVSAFRQILGPDGKTWQSAPVSADLHRDLENAVLARAAEQRTMHY